MTCCEGAGVDVTDLFDYCAACGGVIEFLEGEF